MTALRRTGFVYDELYMWHDTGNYAGPMPYGNPVQPSTHAENPETKRRMRNLLEISGLTEDLHVIKPRMALESEILAFHTLEHLDQPPLAEHLLFQLLLDQQGRKVPVVENN